MIQKFIISALLIISSIAYSQTTNSNEITSYGTAKLKIKPDIANIEITIQKENGIEKDAIKELNEEFEKLLQLLSKLGFTKSHIKISGYKVSSESRYAENGKKTFIATNSIILQFNINNKLINTFYQELQTGIFSDLDIDFDTQLSDELEKDSRKKLLQLAIIDAKNNAENIAIALDLKLGNVKQVSKGFNELSLGSYKKLGNETIKGDVVIGSGPKTSFDKFEVEEKELEETLTIIYEIIKK